MHDHCGVLISAISLNFGYGITFKVEVLALVKWIELAKELQIKKLLVQLDNLARVQILHKQESGRNKYTHMLNKCIDKPGGLGSSR